MTEVFNVKYVESDTEFLEKVASKLSTATGEYFYMPHVFKKLAPNIYQEIPFNALQKEIQDYIKKPQSS